MTAGMTAPVFSVVTPVYNPPVDVFRETVASVLAQDFVDWELILVDDCSSDPEVLPVLRELAASDARIRVIERESNGHIVAASNDGIGVATGEFIALLDHDDLLAEEALSQMAAAIVENPTADYLYSDEDKVDDQGRFYDTFRKPTWSPERQRGQNYTSHLSVLRTELVREVGGFREGFDGSQDHDLVLRVTERARKVVHVPEVLYHWRTVAGSTASDVDAKPYAAIAGQRAVQDHLDRLGIRAEVGQGPVSGLYTVSRTLDPSRRVSIVIPTMGSFGLGLGAAAGLRRGSRPLVAGAHRARQPRGRRRLRRAHARAVMDELRRPPRRSLGPRAVPGAEVQLQPQDEPRRSCTSSGDAIVLLNDDVEVISDRWLEELVAPLDEPDVGMTGAKLYFGNNTIQHAGHRYAGGHFHHIAFKLAALLPGCVRGLAINREVSGVTAACAALTPPDLRGGGRVLRAPPCQLQRRRPELQGPPSPREAHPRPGAGRAVPLREPDPRGQGRGLGADRRDAALGAAQRGRLRAHLGSRTDPLVLRSDPVSQDEAAQAPPRRSWRSYPWHVIVPVAAYVVLVLAGVSQSSIGIHSLREDPRDPSGTMIGDARSIRSDEFLTSTPLNMGVTATGSTDYFNPLAAPQQPLSGLPSGPVSSVVLFDSTALLLGPWLPDAMLLAAHWWIGLLLLALAAPPFFAMLGGSRRVGYLIAALIVFSPATVWWSFGPSSTLGFALGGAVALHRCASAAVESRRGSAVAWGLLSALLLARTPLGYPPWVLILVSSVLLVTVLGIVVPSPRRGRAMLAVTATGLTTALLLFAILFEGRDAYRALADTVYPGQRLSTGGPQSLQDLLGATSLATLTDTMPVTGTNASEISSSFAICFLVAILLLARGVTFRDSGHRAAVIGLAVVSAWWLAWATMDFGTAGTHIPLVNMVPPARSADVVGYLALLLLGLVLPAARPRNEWLFCVMTAGACVVVVAYAGSILRLQNLPELSLTAIWVSSLVVGLVVVALMRWPHGPSSYVFAGLCALLLAWDVNPVLIGLGDLRGTPVADQMLDNGKIARADGSVWASDTSTVDTLLIATGVPSLSGRQTAGPAPEAWQRLVPDPAAEPLWNRTRLRLVPVDGQPRPDGREPPSRRRAHLRLTVHRCRPDARALPRDLLSAAQAGLPDRGGLVRVEWLDPLRVHRAGLTDWTHLARDGSSTHDPAICAAYVYDEPVRPVMARAEATR